MKVRAADLRSRGVGIFASRLGRFLSFGLSLSLITSILTVFTVVPAFAYSSCGNILGNNASSQSLVDNTAKITITPEHGTIFYVDIRRGINASYVAYQITNTATTTKKNLWVKISGFTAASGSSIVSLANPADNLQQIPSLAANASYTVYFLLAANKSTTVAQSHTIEVFNGDPRLSSTGAASTGCDYTFNRVDPTIAANANKVTSVSVSTTTPALGGTVVVTVNGATGTGGAGQSVASGGDGDVMWVSPASVATWPTRALRLERTQIVINRQGNSSVTLNNSLVYMGVNSGSTKLTSKSTYVATYTFRVVGGASVNPEVKPVAQIASGTQMKHTGSYPSVSTINLTSLATPLTVTKTAAATAYTPTACVAGSKFAVRYTITARLAAGTVGTATLDEIVDVPPSGSAFDTQSNQATYSDASPVTNALLGAPSTIAGETPAKLHWTGPFYVTSTTPATFSYTMCVDKVAGTYQNTAYGYVGNTIVGSNSLQVSCQTVTTTGTAFSLGGTCNTTKPKQPQSITFNAPDPVGVGSVTQLSATSSSGLPVVFSTSSSSSICTVAYNSSTGYYEVTAVSAGNCIINANQPGDANYDPATQVSQTLIIKAGQYISVSATTTMLTSTTQDFTARSLKRSDNTTTGLTVTMTSLTTSLCTVAVNGSAPNFRVTSLTTTGVCTLLATQAGDATYGPATDVYVDINIGSLQTINFTNPGNQTSTTSPTSPITISATSVDSGTSANTGLQVTFASLTPAVCDIPISGGNYVAPTISSGVSSTTLNKVSSGVCTLVASQDGTNNGAAGTQSAYSPATDVQISFTIGQPQTITFAKPTDIQRSANSRAITASTTSSLLITFTSLDTSVCTVAAGTLSGGTTTATVTLVAGGSCIITASQAGDGSWYAASPVTQSFLVTGATSQTITFTQSNVNINPTPLTLGSSTALTGSASSGLPVSYSSSTTSVCTVSEIFVTLLTVGNCTIMASQAGDVTYAPASNVTVTFVSFVKPVITFTQNDVVVTTFPQNQVLTSTNQYRASSGIVATGLTNTYASSTTSVCDITSGANLSLKTVGTCTIVASQGANSPNFLAADSVSVSFQVTTGQTITFGALANKTYGDSTFNLSATASSGLTVSFALTTGAGICSLSGTTVTILAAGSCSFTASQAGNASYSAATPVLQSLTVNKKGLTFTATAANKVYNGSDTASLTLSGLTGIINSDAVSIDAAQVSGRFDTPDVGTSKPVTVTLGANTLTGVKAGNYSVSLANSPTANITTKAITMTVSISNKIYDGTVSASIASTSLNGVETGDNVNIDGTKVSGVFADPDKANSKTVTVTLASGVLTGTDATNYTVTVAAAPTANITARAVTVTADNKTKGVSTSDPALTYTITSGSLVSRLGTPDVFTGALTRATGETAATYAITAGNLALSANYALTVNPGTFTITNKTIPIICWSAPTAITYGTALSATQLNAEARASCGVGSALTGTFTYSPLSGVVLTPGTYTLSVTFDPTAPDDATYSSATGSVTIVVNAKPITVTADAKSKTYGATDPALTATVPAGSLVGSDTLTGLLVRAVGEAAGTYAINQGTLTSANNPNYVITYVGANLTIDRKAITVTADTTSKIYGSVDPTLTYTITSGALLPGESLSGTLSRAAGNTYGTYAISQNTVTNTGNPNYNITFVSANFTINKKPITMNVTIANKEYDGQLLAIISGTSLNDIEAGDTVTIDGTKVTGAFADPDVGVGKSVTVTLAANALTGTHASNYSVTVAGTPLANITTRAVTITADNKTKSATAVDPTFTYTVTSGSIVNRLLASQAVTGSLTRANVGTNTPGTYAITIGSFAISSNYAITFVAGTLTISDKTVPVICWSTPVAITYGTELSAAQLNATAREACGLGSDLPGTFVYSPDTGAILIPGTHTLSVTFTPTDSVTYSGATGTVSIVVNPKAITVTADVQTKVYGASDPTFTFTTPVGALVGTDTLSGTLSRNAGSNIGTYAITQGTVTSGNNPKYTVAFVSANLTITTKAITVTADNKTGTVGATTAFTVSAGAGQLVAPDAISGATFTFSGGGYGPNTTVPTSAGTYTITPSSATFSVGSASNYLITYAAGTYTLSATAPPAPAAPAPNTPSKPVPVVVAKSLPVKKVTLTTTVTSATPVILGMITSTTGSTSNRASLAPVPNAMVREAVVVGTTSPASPATPSTSGNSGNTNSNSNSSSNAGGNSGSTTSTTPSTSSTPSTPSTSGNSGNTNSNSNSSSNAGGNTENNAGGNSNTNGFGNGGSGAQGPAEPQEPATPTVIQVFENKPAFVADLSAKIAVSLDMEVAKTQVKDERAIVQLNANTGQIRVQPLNGWTGILKVPTYMATDEAIVEIENVITVNPDPTPKVLVRPTSITRTAFGWTKSPTDTVQKYEVRVNNKLVCETESTTCAVNQLIGPKTKVDVTAIGNEGTRSTVQAGKYSPNKRIKVFTINFDEEKWEFTPTALKKLNTYVDIIRREGFTQAFVLGYTDSQGSPSTSVPLSRKRATVTTEYLKERLPEILFKWFAFGEADPIRKGLDPEDFAANRRAEIYIK